MKREKREALETMELLGRNKTAPSAEEEYAAREHKPVKRRLPHHFSLLRKTPAPGRRY